MGSLKAWSGLEKNKIMLSKERQRGAKNGTRGWEEQRRAEQWESQSTCAR